MRSNTLNCVVPSHCSAAVMMHLKTPLIPPVVPSLAHSYAEGERKIRKRASHSPLLIVFRSFLHLLLKPLPQPNQAQPSQPSLLLHHIDPPSFTLPRLTEALVSHHPAAQS